MTLRSGLDQLRPGFSKIYNLLDDVLPKDLDYLYNLEASVKSLLESSDTSDAGGQTLNSSHGCIRSRSKSKENERLKPRCAAKARIYIWEKKASDLILASHVSVDDVALAAVKDDDCFGVFTIHQIKEAASGIFSTPKETLKFLTKYLATFSGEDANAMEEAKEEVVYTIIEFVKSPNMFQVALIGGDVSLIKGEVAFFGDDVALKLHKVSYEQSHYKQDKTITRQSINVKRHIFNVIGDTEKFEERDLNIGGDC
ncbi:hypothetical protein Tco_0857500 [Tanacetum coccineum]|uniref:Uncharacterized protein n=1 Tax=Tanacetum coccineum TaxID=301880 RepID=A0ABQ5BAD9_9ASTR